MDALTGGGSGGLGGAIGSVSGLNVGHSVVGPRTDMMSGDDDGSRGNGGGGGTVSPLSIPLSEPGSNLRGSMRRQDSVGSGSVMSGGNGGGSESKDGAGEVRRVFGRTEYLQK